MSHSLRGRLLAMLMAVIVAGWLILLGIQYTMLGQQQDGYWARSLRATGEQVLLSLPSDIVTLRNPTRLHLPTARTIEPDRKVSIQVWALDRRQIVFSTIGSPAQPLRPDFTDGYARTWSDGEAWQAYAITDASGRVQVQVGNSMVQLRNDLAHWTRLILGVALLILLGLAAGVWLVIRWSLRPVNRVRQAIAARQAPDLAPLPHANLPEEIRPLVVSFNELLQRLDQAMQNERQFLAEAAHELRTPLAVLLAQTQLALHAQELGQAKAALGNLVQGIERAARLAQQLLDSARVESEHRGEDRQPVELARVASMVADEFVQTAARKRQYIALRAGPGQVLGNLDELGILLRNLIDNALRYGREGGQVEVRCQHDARNGRLVLSVRDDGPGVAEAERERVFERFFRGSGARGERGSGIGLALVARIAHAHGASVQAGPGLDGIGFGIGVAFPPYAPKP